MDEGREGRENRRARRAMKAGEDKGRGEKVVFVSSEARLSSAVRADVDAATMLAHPVTAAAIWIKPGSNRSCRWWQPSTVKGRCKFGGRSPPRQTLQSAGHPRHRIGISCSKSAMVEGAELEGNSTRGGCVRGKGRRGREEEWELKETSELKEGGIDASLQDR